MLSKQQSEDQQHNEISVNETIPWSTWAMTDMLRMLCL